MKFYKSFEEYLQSLGGNTTRRLYPDYLEEDVSPTHSRIYNIMAMHCSPDAFPIANVIKFYVPRKFRTEVLAQLARLRPVRDQESIPRELNCIQGKDLFLIDVENVHWDDVLTLQRELWDFLAKKQPKTECIYMLHLNNMYQSWSEEERFVFQNTFGVSLQFMGGENFDSFLMVKAWCNWGMEVGKEALQNLKKSGKLPSEMKREEFESVLSKFPRKEPELDSSEDEVETVVNEIKIAEPTGIENTYERRWNISSSNYKTRDVETPKSFYPTLIGSKPKIPRNENSLDKGCKTEPEITPAPVVHKTCAVDEETIPRDYLGRMESGESKDQLIFVSGNHGVFTPSELNDYTEDIIEEVAKENKRRRDNPIYGRDHYLGDSSEDESDGTNSYLLRRAVLATAIRLEDGDSSVPSFFDVVTSGREDLTTSEDETDQDEPKEKLAGSMESVASTLKGEEAANTSIVAEYANLSGNELLEKFKENKDWDWINIWRAAHLEEDLPEFDEWREEAIEKHFLSLLSEEQLGTFGALMILPMVIEFVAGLDEKQQNVYDQWKNKPIPCSPSFVPELKLTPQQEKIILPVIREKRFVAMDNFMKYHPEYENLYYLWKKAVTVPTSIDTTDLQLTVADQDDERFETPEHSSKIVVATQLSAPVEEILNKERLPTKQSFAQQLEATGGMDEVEIPFPVHQQLTVYEIESIGNHSELPMKKEESTSTSVEQLSEPLDEIAAMTHLPHPVDEDILKNVPMYVWSSVEESSDTVSNGCDGKANKQGSDTPGQDNQNEHEQSVGNEEQTRTVEEVPFVPNEHEIENGVDALSLLSEQSTTESEQDNGIEVGHKEDSFSTMLEEPVKTALVHEQTDETSGEELHLSGEELTDQNTLIHNVTDPIEVNLPLNEEQAPQSIPEGHIEHASQVEAEEGEQLEETKNLTPLSVVVDHEKTVPKETSDSSQMDLLTSEVPEPEEMAPVLPVQPTRSESNNSLFSRACDVLTSRFSPKPAEKPRGPATWQSALLNAMLDEPMSEPSSVISTDERDQLENQEKEMSTVLATPALPTPSEDVTEPQLLSENITEYTEKPLNAEPPKINKTENSENNTQQSTELASEVTITDNYRQKNKCPSSVDSLANIGEECAKLEELRSSESSLHSPDLHKSGDSDQGTRTPTPSSLSEFEHVTSADVDEIKEETSNC